MDDVQNDAPDGLEGLLAGIEQSDATEEASTAEADANAETTDQETEGSEADAEKDGETEENEDDKGDDDEPKRKKPSGSERQRRRIERLEAELNELRERRPAAAGDAEALKSAVEAEIGPEPKEADFPDFFEFSDARAAWKAAKVLVEREVKKDSRASRNGSAREGRGPGRRSRGPSRRSREAAPRIEGEDRRRDERKGRPAHRPAHPRKRQERASAAPPRRTPRQARRAEPDVSGAGGARSRPPRGPPVPAQTPNRNQGSSACALAQGRRFPVQPETDLEAWLGKTYGKR
jgi:hypothetical protein